DLVGKSRQIGDMITNYFTELKKELPIIAEVRGLGAMCAIELIDPATKQPAKELAASFTKACCENGVIVLSAGVHGNVIRFLTPLVITPEQLQEGLEIMGENLRNLVAKKETAG
ncbi:aminotransferase class III-fold pyridoxal phosphate-dependent enzyme, partial [Microbacteriaceae bacterium K1510]|nr:aminotransferase class III-fold pyridoxal phosphate-dependent enzyme [Microbacteriaceae bacterium K1510]